MGPRETASLPCDWEEVETWRCSGVGPGLFDLECGKDNETGKGAGQKPWMGSLNTAGDSSWYLVLDSDSET